jgi:aspartyl/asparaginyl-tRNA synthetase
MQLKEVTKESVLKITGVVKNRPEKDVRDGVTVEIELIELTILNVARDMPIYPGNTKGKKLETTKDKKLETTKDKKLETTKVENLETTLRHREISLRRPDIQRILS